MGVLQAKNTWAHHFATSLGASRQERNLLNAVSRATANPDHAMAVLLGQVLDG